MVEPSKIIFLIQNAIPQKEDIILLYIGYHSILKIKTTHVEANQPTITLLEAANTISQGLGFRRTPPPCKSGVIGI